MATARRKPKPKIIHQKLAAAWYSHPVAVISLAATCVGLVAGVIPGVRWLIDRIDAKSVEAKLEAHKLADVRDGAWRNVQSAKVDMKLVEFQAVALRNRVNDCDIDHDKRQPMTTLEQRACQQYRDEFKAAQDEYNDAAKRLEQAKTAALLVSKDK